MPATLFILLSISISIPSISQMARLEWPRLHGEGQAGPRSQLSVLKWLTATEESWGLYLEQRSQYDFPALFTLFPLEGKGNLILLGPLYFWHPELI